MTRPSTARAHAVLDSPIGPLTAVADGDGALCGLYFERHLRQPDPATFGHRADDDAEGFEEVRRQLAAYFAGDLRTFDLPLAPVGDAFAQRVWAQLREIPYGETRTYGGLATELGDPHWAQAVGRANALNPIGIVQPCHRVIGADGRLTGFAGGLGRKQFLLDLEAPPAEEAGRLW